MGAILKYSQGSGLITDGANARVALGWAGNGDGKNNPTMQTVRSTGPLPQGLYRVGPWHDHPRLGPMVAELTMLPDQESYGRDDFFIHGPARDPAKTGQESRGCIVVPRAGREKVRELDPSYIWVVA